MLQKSLLLALSLAASLQTRAEETPPTHSGSPLFPGWYADPEAIIIGNEYWIYPTYSAPFKEQLHFDAFSSKDLVKWPGLLGRLRHRGLTDGAIQASSQSHAARSRSRDRCRPPLGDP